MLGASQLAKKSGAELGLNVPAIGTRIERTAANRLRQFSPGLRQGQLTQVDSAETDMCPVVGEMENPIDSR